jgi:hypothetical protein
MSGQNDDVAGDMSGKQPVEAKKADDAVDPAITRRTNGSARPGRSASGNAMSDHFLWVDDLVEPLFVDGS